MKAYSVNQDGAFELKKETDDEGNVVFFARCYDSEAGSFNTGYWEKVGGKSMLEAFKTMAADANRTADIASTRDMIMKIDADPEAMADYLQFGSVDEVRACAARMWLSLDDENRPPRPSQLATEAPPPAATTAVPPSITRSPPVQTASKPVEQLSPFAKAIARAKDEAENTQTGTPRPATRADNSRNPWSKAVARAQEAFHGKQ